MNAQTAKIFGWAQFAFQVIGQAFESGIPHSPLGWLTLLSSLATAVGVHASATVPSVPLK